MKKGIVFISLVFSILAFSCSSGDSTKGDNEKTTNKKNVETEKADMTIELYAKIVNEQRALLVEKYWPQFKGKDREENRDLYNKYIKEKGDILEKHGFDRDYELSRYFRNNTKEVMKYQRANPDFIEYPEYGEAKMAIIDMAMGYATE